MSILKHTMNLAEQQEEMMKVLVMEELSDAERKKAYKTMKKVFGKKRAKALSTKAADVRAIKAKRDGAIAESLWGRVKRSDVVNEMSKGMSREAAAKEALIAALHDGKDPEEHVNHLSTLVGRSKATQIHKAAEAYIKRTAEA